MLGMVIQGLIEFSAPCNHCGRPFIKSQAGNLRLGVNIVPLYAMESIDHINRI